MVPTCTTSAVDSTALAEHGGDLRLAVALTPGQCLPDLIADGTQDVPASVMAHARDCVVAARMNVCRWGISTGGGVAGTRR